MRKRLVLTTGAVILAAIVAFAVPLAVSLSSLLQSRALDSVQGTAEQVGLFLDANARDCAELQLRVAQHAGPLDLTVVSSGPQIVATTADDGVVQLGEELNAATEGRVGRSVAAGRLAVAVPLSTNVCDADTQAHRPGEISLVLVGDRDDVELRGEVRAAWWNVGLLAVVVGGIGLAIAWLAGRTLAVPLETLALSAARLGEGDFSARAPRSGLPEADAIAEALDTTAERLDRALARSAAFTSDASHQMRTPLTALRLHLESLQAEGAAADSIAAALAEADRLENTMEELVALTKIDAPEAETELADVVEELLPAWQSTASKSGREVTTELEQVGPVRIRSAALAQALQVLVDNALAHTEGTVKVVVGDAGANSVSVCVIDQGSGPDHIQRRPGGRGLPLAQALVTAEGGRLSFTAAPGGGARACVILPRT